MTKTREDKTAFGTRILELRRDRGWSQPELGRKIGTSGAIIGRYGRGEMSPSIDVARKLADVFGVTVDSLISEREIPDLLRDQSMIERWRSLDQLPGDERDRILYVVDGLIRDAQTRRTYAAR